MKRYKISLADSERSFLVKEGEAILTAALLLGDDPDTLMLVAPSDHVITDNADFHRDVDAGVDAARAGGLVTFGVTPDRPETGYGYLELSGPPVAVTAVKLTSFQEKPDAATAALVIEAGRHLWNTGIFLFRPADVIAAFGIHAPDLLAPCRAAIEEGAEALGFFHLGRKAYCEARAISFGCAVLEHADNVVAVPLGSGWSDLGS